MQATAAVRPFVTQQRPATPRHRCVVVSAAAGQQRQHPGQPLERRSVLLGAAALLAAPWLQQGQAALAQDFSCEPKAGPSGIKWCDIAGGFGAPAEAGARIRVHFEGRLPDGSVFASSYDPPAPLAFQVGAGEVPKGWELGILGGEGMPPMVPGTRRRLVLPPELARPGSKVGGAAPSGATVTYDVTFLGKAM